MQQLQVSACYKLTDRWLRWATRNYIADLANRPMPTRSNTFTIYYINNIILLFHFILTNGIKLQRNQVLHILHGRSHRETQQVTAYFSTAALLLQPLRNFQWQLTVSRRSGEICCYNSGMGCADCHTLCSLVSLRARL